MAKIGIRDLRAAERERERDLTRKEVDSFKKFSGRLA